MQQEIEDLKKLVGHLWYMPGGPACKEAELRFNSLAEKSKKK